MPDCPPLEGLGGPFEAPHPKESARVIAEPAAVSTFPRADWPLTSSELTQAVHESPFALRRPTGPRRPVDRANAPFVRGRRRRQVLVQSARDTRGTAPVGETDDAQRAEALGDRDAQQVTVTQRLRRLRRLLVDLDLAAVTRLRRQRARLEDARGPQPAVGPDRLGRCRS